MYAIKFADGSYCSETERGTLTVLIWEKSNHPKTKITYMKRRFGYPWYAKHQPHLLKKWEKARIVEVEVQITITEV